LNFLEEIDKVGVHLETQEMKNFKNFKRNIRIIENHQKNIDLEEEIYIEGNVNLNLDSDKNDDENDDQNDVWDLNIQTEIKIYNLEELLEYICVHVFTLLFEILAHNKDEEIILLILSAIDLII
jgi:hypothetical protein